MSQSLLERGRKQLQFELKKSNNRYLEQILIFKNYEFVYRL